MSFKHFFLFISTLGILFFSNAKADASAEKFSGHKKISVITSPVSKINYFIRMQIDDRMYLVEFDNDGKIVSVIEIDE